MKRRWTCFPLIVVLLFLSSIRMAGQAAPGLFADANHPAGPPDPEKLDAIWQVDPITDQVSINVPFPTVPQSGRGPKLPFSLLYNSASTVTLQAVGTYYVGNAEQLNTFQWSAYPLATPIAGPTGPWTTTGPYFYDTAPPIVSNAQSPGCSDGVCNTYIGCSMDGPYIYVDASGASHDLNLIYFSWNPGYSETSPPQYAIPACAAASSSFYSAGSTPFWPNSATYDGSTLATSSNSVTGPDGTSVSGGSQGASLTDANGNVATLGAPSNGWVTAIDALGRIVFTTNIPIGQTGQIPAGTYSLTTYGATGTAETYTIVFSTETLGTFPNYQNTGMAMPHPNPASEIIPANFCIFASCSTPQYYSVAQPGPGPSPFTNLPVGSFTAVTSVSLPDGTQSNAATKYTFSYDPVYGTISKINFPTGGYVRFVWGVRDEDWTPFGQFEEISSIVVTDVYESPTGSAGNENHWGYTPQNSETPASLSTSSIPIGYVYAPDGSYTYYTGQCNFDFDIISDFSIGPKYSCKENSHANYSSSGVLVASEAEQYTRQGLTWQVASTLYGGSSPMQKQTVLYYDNFNNVIEKDESDYSPCSLSGTTCPLPVPTISAWLRKTYASFSGTSSACNSTLASKNIVDKPCQVNVTDGSGNPYSLTNYGYDNNGNLLNESKCLSISGKGSSATCSAAWQTQYCYIPTTSSTCPTTGTPNGQVYLKTEAYGVMPTTTQYTWGPPQAGLTTISEDGQNLSVSQNGYLTTVTAPNGDQDLFTYSPYTGQAESHTDWNSQTTNYTYNDNLNMGRISNIGYPDGGATSYYYTDAYQAWVSPSVQTTITTGESSGNVVETSVYDGLGRLSETQLNSDPYGVDRVDTAYDSVGRVYSVSNPFRGASGSGSFFIYSYYDPANRLTKRVNQDGSAATTNYLSNVTSFTDENNNQWNRVSDGLGRLTEVTEPDGANTYYTYNPLGDLTCAAQNGGAVGTFSSCVTAPASWVLRIFTYDSLSRLTQAKNPETGTVTYIYSSTGNACASDATLPCSRTDARGVTTGYTYDILNRLTIKSYSDGNTPWACYLYDSATHGAGRLAYEWTQKASIGACSASFPPSIGFLTGRAIASPGSGYDKMGRLLGEQQYTPASIAASTSYSINYTYDLAGNLTSSTSGIPPSSVAGSSTSPTVPCSNGASFSPPTFSFVNCYDAAGRLSSVTSNASNGPSALFAAQGYWPSGGLTNATYGVNAVTLSRTFGPRLNITSELDSGNSPSSGTSGAALVTITGAEQSH
jgi:YD repeat-containing protein